MECAVIVSVLNMSAAEFDRELIERYGGRGPRYTSYPTAVQFSPEFGEADYRAQVRASNNVPERRPLSVYVHVPFCHSLCFYCGCSKIVTRNSERAEQYLVSLLREVELQGALFDRARVVEQLHLGGGTPTYLKSSQMNRLMEGLATYFSLRTDGAREFSIEVDPRTVGVSDIESLAASGFNRISLGVQDFTEEVQRAVNRVQSFESTREIVDAARHSGFGSVSLDLIYGLPLQTVESFERSLDQVLAIRPDRLAVYSYAHLPQMFRAQKLIREEQLPSPGVKLELLARTSEKLLGAGYVYVGMDHFALATDELVVAQRQGLLQRNFQGYSTHGDCDLVGLGLTSIGRVGDCYSQNAKEMGSYTGALDQARLPIERGLVTSRDDRIRGAVIQQIMCHGRLDYAWVADRCGIDFEDYFADELPRLARLSEDGLLELGPDGLVVSGRGRMLVRAIAMVFDRYLTGTQGPRTFSKII